MDKKPVKLGRGIEDILFGRKDVIAPVPIQPAPATVTTPAASDTSAISMGPQYIPIDQIRPNPNQPRKAFTEEALKDLVASIEIHGLIQPVAIRKREGAYELIAGERRLRAMQSIGKTTIPAIVIDVDDQKSLELSLIENIQREDLNPIERARAYEQLVTQFKITHEEAARRIGQSRTSLTNMLRILALPNDIQEKVSRGTISYGHARALVAINDPNRQQEIANQIERDGLSVRQVERIASRKPRAKILSRAGRKTNNIRYLEENLMKSLGTKVTIDEGKNKGKIIIEFYSPDDFDRILKRLGVSSE
ncbi:MAG: ParB/RepB/Spo0J family partition protein [Planctomycetota bacterium]